MPIPKSSERLLDRLSDDVCHALEVLTRLGVDHADVQVGTGKQLEVAVRQGEVELLKEAQSSGMSVRVIYDGRVATSGTTDLDAGAVEKFLERAVEMAQLAEEDPLAKPPDEDLLVDWWWDLDLFDPRTDRIGAKKGIKLAIAGEKAAFAHDGRITSSEGSSFSRMSGHSVFGTTGGFMGDHAGTYQSLVVQAVADDEGGKKRNGYYWTGSRFYEELDNPRDVGREAARRAVRSLGARKMSTGTYPIVFDKDAARGIVGLFAGCVLGDALYRDRSYLKKSLGKQVASRHVTIIDDPLLPRAPGSRPFDSEGLRVRRNVVVKRGMLQTYLLDTYSARKLKLESTGSAGGAGGVPHSTTSNFYLARGRFAPKSLFKGIHRGLYVMRMMGFGFDPVTGDLSRGAEGFLIEDGRLTVPIGEITISRNLQGILTGIDQVADDLEFKTSTTSPSFRVDEMTVAGT